MHVEKKRIFVGNLPPYVDENEIKKQFSQYGNVVSVDIKQRKGGNADENVSPVFAFVNIEIDDRTLQKCFQEIADYNWQGYYVNLQLAKESFLDRLKREREEAQAKNNDNNTINSSTTEQISVPSAPPPNSINRKAYKSSSESDDKKPEQNGNATPKNVSKKKESSSSSSSDSDDSDDGPTKQNNKIETVKKVATKKESSSSSSDSSDSSDEEPKKTQNNKQTPVDPVENNDDDDGFKLVIKSNKHKIRENGGLKIESVNSTPIHVITKKGTKNVIKDQKSIEADLKRKQSLMQMKNSYNQQKLAIKNALSNVDTKQKISSGHDQQKNKKRDYDNDEYSSKRQKLSLFDDEGEEDHDDNIDFSVKHQFEGKKGQRLLEIQSRYNKDHRFALDERFADEEDEYEMEGAADDEKEKQLEILESVLGQKVRKDFRDDNKTSNIPKGMLRYDPSKPEHSKFQIKRDEYSKKDRKKDKREFEKERVEVAPVPEVSKEKFYEVKGDLKESLKEKEGFSLLSMFGRAEEKDDDANEYGTAEEIKKNNKYDYERNPFKYDSSDTEDEEPNKQKNKQKQKREVEPQPSFRWAESFFFEPNDNRLKDGLEFLKNLSTNSETFKEKRRALQRIVYGKVRNVERDKRKFQNKLRKRIKVKKAIRKS